MTDPISPTDNPAQDPAQSGTTSEPETAPNGQAPEQGKDASVPQTPPNGKDDSFTDVDVKSLPPELQGMAKSLQADYTRKTMAAAESRKKAEAYDRLLSDPRYQKWQSQTHEETPATTVDAQKGFTLSEEDYVKALSSKEGFQEVLEKMVGAKSQAIQEKMHSFEQQARESKAKDFIEEFAEAVDEKGNKIHPDVYELNEDGLIAGYLRVNRPSSEKDWPDALQKAYQWAKSVVEKPYKKGFEDGLKGVKRKAEQSTLPPGGTGKEAYSGPDPRSLTPKQAMEFALKGQKVPEHA